MVASRELGKIAIHGLCLNTDGTVAHLDVGALAFAHGQRLAGGEVEDMRRRRRMEGSLEIEPEWPAEARLWES